jgi:hypothetical protein
MRKILAVFAICFLTLLSGVSEACSPRRSTIEQRVENASGIYFGQVTGVRYDAVERSLDRGGSVTIGGNELDYTLRVYVKQTLKGKMQKIVAAEIHSCGNGSAQLGDSLLVFISSDGSAFISTDKETLAAVQTILAKALTTQSR